MRLEDEISCADAFWLYWPKMSGNYPRVAGKRERDGEFGDGWAWDEWDGMKDRNAVAGIMECVATCFAGLQRFVQTPIHARGRWTLGEGVITAHGMAESVQNKHVVPSVNAAYGSVPPTRSTENDAFLSGCRIRSRV